MGIFKKMKLLFTIIILLLLSNQAISKGYQMSEKTLHLNTARASHSMSLLANGNVFVFGGTDVNEKAISSGELIDFNNKKIVTINGSVDRYNHIAVTTEAKNIVLIGGINENGLPVPEIEAFDPSRNQLKIIGHLRMPRQNALALPAAQGNIIIAGGEDSTGNILSSIEVFNITTGETRLLKTAMQIPRANHQGIMLEDNKFLVSGGKGNQKSRTTAEIIDLNYSPLSLVVELQENRILHTANDIPGVGYFIYSNGIGELISVKDSISSNITFKIEGEIRDKHTATLVDDSSILIAGASIPAFANELLGNPILYNYQSNRIIKLEDPLNLLNRSNHKAVRLSNGNILISGGRTTTEAATDDLIIFNPIDKSFKPLK